VTELTTQRVIFALLVIVFVLPLFSFSFWDHTTQLGKGGLR
jgi:hypothetical protein